jgi:hypothetical protein
MKAFRIKGKVSYQNIGTGFWGIIDNKGNEWRPVHMPDQLKEDGKKIEITAKKTEEGMSIFMWGEAIEIVSFET